MKPPIEDVIQLLSFASEEILKIYKQSIVDVKEKEDNTPVTDADTVSNAFILDGLMRLTPHIPVVAEESTQLPYEVRKLWTFCWLLDPLDGTKEFINRNGEFTINLGLICDSTPYWGIIYQPVTGECWYGGSEDGSFHRNAYGDITRLTKALHYTNLKSIKVLTSRSHINEHTAEFLKKLESEGKFAEPVPCGSALKFCRLAEGKAHLYPRTGRTMEWDTAAGQAILEGAGGQVLDWNTKRPLRYNKENLQNPWFIAE